MEDVARFSYTDGEHGPSSFSKNENGSLVSWADYLVLRDERDEALKLNKPVNINVIIYDMQEAYDHQISLSPDDNKSDAMKAAFMVATKAVRLRSFFA